MDRQTLATLLIILMFVAAFGIAILTRGSA